MTDFEKFKEKLPRKEKFYNSLTGKKLMTKIWSCSYGLEQVWNENDEILSRFLFKIWRFVISKASNKYLKFYDPKQESKYIKYLEVNNMCGCPISEFLQTSGFKWTDPKSLTWINILAIVQKDVLSKSSLNILKSCENYTMIIL